MFEPLEPLDALPLLALLVLALVDDALADAPLVFRWVAARVANATKLPRVTPRIAFLSPRTLWSACAFGMRGATAGFAGRGMVGCATTGVCARIGRVGRSGWPVAATVCLGTAGRAIGGYGGTAACDGSYGYCVCGCCAVLISLSFAVAPALTSPRVRLAPSVTSDYTKGS